MGMLMAMTMLKQKEAEQKAAEATMNEEAKEEEIPFAEPEKKPVQKTAARGRRKGTK